MLILIHNIDNIYLSHLFRKTWFRYFNFIQTIHTIKQYRYTHKKIIVRKNYLKQCVERGSFLST